MSIIALHTQRRNDVCVHVHVMKQEPMKSNDVTTNKLSFPLFHPHFVILCFLASFAHSLARRRRFHSISHSLNCGVGFYFSPSLSLTRRPIVFNEYRSHSIALDTISALTVLYLGTRVGKAFRVPTCACELVNVLLKLRHQYGWLLLGLHVNVIWRRNSNTSANRHTNIQAASQSVSQL